MCKALIKLLFFLLFLATQVQSRVKGYEVHLENLDNDVWSSEIERKDYLVRDLYEIEKIPEDNYDKVYYPSLLELYNNLTSIFDPEAIVNFIHTKNETDENARDLLSSIDNYMRGPKAKKIVNYLWGDVEFTGVS